MADEPHDVFISYNRKDKSFAEFLVTCLEQSGLKCFQDVSGLKIFDKLDASLKLAIAKSRWLMAIISPSYLQSYWCLFEALEAIQGQDVEQRFRPLVLRYSPDDQFLDESFVLKALADLDEQATEFERQMVQLKAYDLSAKLDKLHFVRANLPKIFRMVQERIFPEFLVWDDDVVRETLCQMVGRLSPKAVIDFKSMPLTFDRLAATPLVIPRLKELPSLLWQARVGCQAWKNSPLVVGNQVLVGSAGSKWNEPDPEDGVYSLDAQSGAINWFAPTPADANRLLLSKGVVTTGCDDGSVVAITARDGSQIWRIQLDSGVVGGPIKLSANTGTAKARFGGGGVENLDPLLVVTYGGHVYLLDLWTGSQLQDLDIGHQVVGDPLLYKLNYSDLLTIPTVDGVLVFLEYSDISIRLTLQQETALQYPSEYSESGNETSLLLASRPVLAEGLILQGIVRNTYYPEAPIIAIDAQTRETRWIGTDPDKKVDGFGNLRAAPLVLGREVIFTSAYSGVICALSLDDGRLLWTVDLGQGMFEQWCGPIAVDQSVYIGRHDGYLHKVDVRQHRREWSMFLGAGKQAGTVISGKQKLPEFDAAYSWNAGASSPILATPVVDSGRLYAGTEEGYLYCIGNLGED